MIRNMRLVRAASIAALVIAAPARAALVCADTGDEIQAALDQVMSIGEDATIRIVAGTYARPFYLSLTEQAPTIDISGGWNAGCTAQDGGSTILDGQHAHQILYMDSFGSARAQVRISRLTFVGGEAPDSTFGGVPGGLDIWGTAGIVIEQNQFIGNAADTHTPAALGVYGPGSGLLILRNNLFVANTGQCAAFVNDSSTAAVISGNTFVANTSNASSTGGLVLDGSAAYVIANNILWNNTGGDLYLAGSGGQYLFHNDIGFVGGTPIAPGSEGNLSVAPQFASGLLNFRLAPDSPLVNRGFDLSSGDIGAWDLAGGERLQGVHVDIGAYESDVLLRDGFDPG